MEFEYIEDEIDNVSTINNIPIIRPIESKRAKTSQNDHKRAFYSQSSLRSMQNTSEKLFHASFKPEDCKSLKTKLAKLEPVVDKYAPPSSHQFRDEIPNEKPVLFTTRFKNKPLENPYNMSEHDLRPKESLDKEQKERQRKEREEEINLSMFLGKFVGKKEWIKNFRRADLHRKEGFIDHKHPKFIEKGRYVEPTQIMNNLLRGEANYEENFKLFHRSLRSTDKNLYFGQNMDGKF